MSHFLNQKAKVNGNEVRISYNKSRATKWNINQGNINTLKVLDKLLFGDTFERKFLDGIEVINAVGTLDLMQLGITRPSNEIMKIRAELPTNTLITYNPKGELPKYGITKSERSKKAVDELRAKLIKILDKKGV